MTLQSIIDPKKKALVREALKRGDPLAIKSKKKTIGSPLIEQSPKIDPLTQQTPQRRPPSHRPIPKRQRYPYSQMSDEQLVDFAIHEVNKYGIRQRKHLQHYDSALYNELRKRRLLDQVLPKRYMEWGSMSDGELVDFARHECATRGITNKRDLKHAFNPLYRQLLKRRLLDYVFK